MKHIQMLCIAGAILSLATSCLKDEGNYQAGFPVLGTKSTYMYANNVTDSFYVASYGPWKITAEDNSNWIKLDLMEGKGYASYSFGIKMEQNTTGKERSARYNIKDTSHPDDAYLNWNFRQLATRGDGSLGNAAMVSSITGSDNSKITLTYDSLHRPLTLVMTKDDVQLHALTLSYQDYSQKMTVNTGTTQLTATCDNSYQPQMLTSTTDTIRLVEQTYFNLYHSKAYAFNIEQCRADGSYAVFAHLVNEMNAYPDSLHCTDSLRYQSRKGRNGAIDREYMGLSYSTQDNRCQSVDVNQLILGVERCNPYLLLSLYRYARSSKIISLASFERDADNITVRAELNADKSVKKLFVTRYSETITYEFTYE